METPGPVSMVRTQQGESSESNLLPLLMELTMNRKLKLIAGVVVMMGLGVAGTLAVAQSAGHGKGMGMGMMHGGAGGHTGMLTKQDAGSAADMGLVETMVHNNTKIRRTVTELPNGIRTLTESDDAKIAQAIQAHVASMSQRLKDGREFNISSKTLPVLFANSDKITSKVEMTAKGAAVTRTSTDAKVVAALQGHAKEVTELVDEGMVAMRRGMMQRMGMGMGGQGEQHAGMGRMGGMDHMSSMHGKGAMGGMGGMNGMGHGRSDGAQAAESGDHKH
jgi:hypothetical protein